MNPTEFLTELWTGEPPGRIALWRLDGRRSYYLVSPHAADSYALGQTDIYTGVSLARSDLGRSKRVTSKTAVAIPGLWLDIDVNGGPDNKTGAAESTEAAVALSRSYLEPTILVASGYGVHAWYLFEEPWAFASTDEQRAAAIASAQWQKLHRDAAPFALDSTHDLARLLRLPGSRNGRGGGDVPVDVIERGARRQRDVLLTIAAAAGEVELTAVRDPTDPVVDVVLRADVALDEDKFDALKENSPEFARALQHRGRNESQTWTLSEWDLCLCSLAAQQANWSDQELANLIVVHRRTYDPSDTKGLRADYVKRTVARARGDAQRNDSLEYFRNHRAVKKGAPQQ